jgi:protein gp37
MGANSRIEWCDHTFNPWLGCTKVAPPCDHCYAESWAKRSGLVQWGPHAQRRRTSPAKWREPIKWNAQAQAAGWRARVFCASLADWLDNQVPDAWRNDLADLIRETPSLDWLLLTKRVGNFERHAPWDIIDVPDTVWIGITCGDQKEFDRDWPLLACIDAPVRFISYEPALGPLRIAAADCVPDWVIAGGESGHHARPANPQWFRDLRDDCATLHIAFHFKQWGEWAPGTMDHFLGGERIMRLPDNKFMARVGKSRAGRLLDGHAHNEFPSSQHGAIV